MRSMTSAVKDHPSVVAKTYTLTVNDRCDKCQAQALVKVKGASGELLFCSHHYNKIMNNPKGYEKMMSFIVEVIDEREKLEKNKPIGAI